MNNSYILLLQKVEARWEILRQAYKSYENSLHSSIVLIQYLFHPQCKINLNLWPHGLKTFEY